MIKEQMNEINPESVISIEGKGTVISQDYLANEQVQEGTIIKVTLKKEISGGAQ